MRDDKRAGMLQVRKIGKQVFIRGGIKATGSVSAYNTTFTLPVGYAPSSVDAHLIVRYAGGETFRQIAVNVGGAGVVLHSLANTDTLRVSGSWLIDKSK